MNVVKLYNKELKLLKIVYFEIIALNGYQVLSY